MSEETTYSTIASAIAAWLSEYSSIDVATNYISDGADTFGLFKAPTRTTKNFINGTYEITEYYSFFARQAAVSEGDREDSDAWLENLAYWADDYPLLADYPALTGNRTINQIELTGAPYPMETGSDDMLYQMSISITYTRDREV